ncbi:MAG: chaperone NapD [Pseudomonadota bacterium]|nr:chaperone NapD [Pseudomonadota bacterium]
MNICSLVVHARPEERQAVESRLLDLPGLEIHGVQAEGKLVVTVEDTEQSLAADTMMAINDVKGVLNAVLIYHYGGDEPLAEEVIRERNST